MKDMLRSLEIVAIINDEAINHLYNAPSNNQALALFRQALQLLFDMKRGFPVLETASQNIITRVYDEHNQSPGNLSLLTAIPIHAVATETFAKRHKIYSMAVLYNIALLYYNKDRSLHPARMILSLCIALLQEEPGEEIFSNSTSCQIAILVFHLLGCVHTDLADRCALSEKQANFAVGLHLFERAQTLAIKEFGPLHSTVYDTMHAIGWALVKANCISSAITVFEKASHLRNHILMRYLSLFDYTEDQHIVSPAA